MSFNKISLIMKGAAMGIAETIPGVSGGTIAFITGIYERLINSIKSINPSLIKTFREDKFSGIWKKIDGEFLVVLGIGMIIGLVVGTKIFSKLLESFPLQLWSFFFGLIIASAYFVGKQVQKWNILRVVLLIVFACVAYGVTIVAPAAGSSALWLVFLSGAIAVSALMLPGLSGSFILLLMGMYSIILPTFKNLIEEPNTDDLKIILVFISGCITGLLTFVHLLSWTYKNYKESTLAALTGFLIGSLNKLWPWQDVFSTRVNSHGEEVPAFTKSIMPSTFETLTNNIHYGNDPKLIWCILMIIGGLVLVLALEKFSNQAEA